MKTINDMIKKIFKILFYLLFLAGFIVLVSFAVKVNKSSMCKSFTINVDYSCGNLFVDSQEIKNSVYERFDTLPGQPFDQLNLSSIENFISQKVYVSNADVYRTIEGKLKVDVVQRKPLARVINKNGHSFYIDKEGNPMPLSNDYTARVMIFTGDIDSRYSSLVELSEQSKDEFNEGDLKLLKDIYKIAAYINNHNFFHAFIDHMHFSSDGSFELIPKNGSHVVEFGNTERMEQKFNKLMLFYNKGLTNIGWNKYSNINLKYKNQVICAK